MAKKKKLDRELEQIKRMQSINDIINKSNLENQLLYSSATREGEAANDSIADNILNNSIDNKIINKDLKVIEDITSEDAKNNIKMKKRVKIKKATKVMKVHSNPKSRTKIKVKAKTKNPAKKKRRNK